MANELLGLDYVFAIIVEVSYLRCSEVVALDFHPIGIVELGEHLRPLVSRVGPITSRKHDLRVRCTQIVLVCFDSIDCLLVNHDCASARLLGSDMQLATTMFINFELCDGTKGQTNDVLYT